MEKVIVYTQPDCRYCNELIHYLNSDNVLYEEKSILDPIHRKQVVDFGATRLPFTIVGDLHLSGLELSTIPRIKKALLEGGV